MRIEKLFSAFATQTARLAGRPWTFIACLALVVGWAITGPIFQYSQTWQLVINTGTTIITFLMVFLIQNSQNRDAAAMHAKLDELIYSLRHASNGFIGIEHLTDRELTVILDEVEKRARTIRAKHQAEHARQHLPTAEEEASSQPPSTGQPSA